MRVAAYALRSIATGLCACGGEYDQLICMVLRSGSFEAGVRRSEIKKYAYDAGEMILAPRHDEQWFRTDDLHLLVVAISDAALTEACDGGKADLRYGPKLVDARVGELITAVNAERIAAFPNGPLFLDSAEQELASALVDRHSLRRRSASTYHGGLTPARLRRVVDLVRAKIEDEVTLDELAESVGLSTAHFADVSQVNREKPAPRARKADTAGGRHASCGCRRGMRVQNPAALCACVPPDLRSQPNGISARICKR